MINFIKNLLGLNKPTETVKEILTPTAKTDVLATALTASTYIEPAKPLNKVKAISVPATASNSKPKAKPAVKEGNQRANVKTPNTNTAKPSAPPKPVPGKKKARRK